MQVIRRSEWGARFADGAGAAPVPAGEIWLHHSAGVLPDLTAPYDDDCRIVRDIETECENRFGQGMSYTFLVSPAGLVFEGHTVGTMGAHTLGHNSAGRAVCWLGNYETAQPSDQTIESTAALLVAGRRAGWWTRHTFTGGHRDVYSTACPGRHAYDALGRVNQRADQLWTPTGGGDGDPESIPSLAYGQTSDAVMHLQRFMVHNFAAYNGYAPTGYYGDKTAAGLAEFQRRVGIVGGDGRNVGPQTKSALWSHGYRP